MTTKKQILLDVSVENQSLASLSVVNKNSNDKNPANNVSYTEWKRDERLSLKAVQTPQSTINKTNKEVHDSDVSSLLSLHLNSYATSLELMRPHDSSNEQYLNRVKKVKSRLKSKLVHKDADVSNAFERPRDVETDIHSTPDAARFKSTFKLINPASVGTPSTPTSTRKRKLSKGSQDVNYLSASAVLSSTNPPLRQQSTVKFKAPSLPKIMTPEEMENYQYDEPELREWQKIYLNRENINPEVQKLKEEIIRLEKENKTLRNENLDLKSANTKLKDARQEKKGLSTTKRYELYHPRSQAKIVNEVWKAMEKKYGTENAATIINAIRKRKLLEEKNSLTPLQTLQLFKSAGITVQALRKMRTIFLSSGIHNPFASEYAVNQERAELHKKVAMTKKNVLLDGKNGEKLPTNVFYAESVENELKDRIATIVKSDNYEPFYFDGIEEIPCVFSGDKGQDLTTVIMGVGSTKRPRNSPNNCSLLGYFKGNDSQSNLYAAFGGPGCLADQIDRIKEIEVEIDGVLRKFKIRWFVLGDFKFLNAIAGLNSNSCSYPCWGCQQKPETTYGEFDINMKAAKRTMDINVRISQIREPLFKSIPFDHYIPPILHITLGPGAQLFEAICERARELDAVELQSQIIEEKLPSDTVKKSWLKMQEKIEHLKDQIEQLNQAKTLYEIVAGENRYVCDSPKCYAVQAGIEINNIFYNDRHCVNCSKYFHSCCLYKEQCPNCSQKFPSLKQSQGVIDKQYKEIEKQLKHNMKMLKEEDEKVNSMISKFKLGRLAANVEKTYEKYGGSRKAFFQEFTGKQLSTMGSNIHPIFVSLDPILKSDPQIKIIVGAIIQFFNIKKLLKTDVLKTNEMNEIEECIKEFADFMKEKMPEVRVKQKGHVFFKHLPEFVKQFHIAAYFIDECIESFHVILNKYKRRIGNRKEEKLAELLFKLAMCMSDSNTSVPLIFLGNEV